MKMFMEGMKTYLSDKSIFSPPQISIFWSNEPISANQCALTANIPPGIAGVWKGSLRTAFKMLFTIVWRFDPLFKSMKHELFLKAKLIVALR